METVMTDAELTRATDDIGCADLESQSEAELELLITIMQHAFDRLLNELERRGLLAMHEGRPVVPYVADLCLETILTRANN